MYAVHEKEAYIVVCDSADGVNFGGMNMSQPKLKMVVFLALGFFIVLAPLSSTSLSGFAYAQGHPEHPGNPIAPVPEPATWLLVGSGLGALALFWKKFKK